MKIRMCQKSFVLLKLTIFFIFLFFFVFFLLLFLLSWQWKRWVSDPDAGSVCFVVCLEMWVKQRAVPAGESGSGFRCTTSRSGRGNWCGVHRDRNSAGGLPDSTEHMLQREKNRSYINNLQRLSLHFIYYVNLVNLFLTFTLLPVKAMRVQ